MIDIGATVEFDMNKVKRNARGVVKKRSTFRREGVVVESNPKSVWVNCHSRHFSIPETPVYFKIKRKIKFHNVVQLTEDERIGLFKKLYTKGGDEK